MNGKRRRTVAIVAVVALLGAGAVAALIGCGGRAKLVAGEDTGSRPVIAAPNPSAIPTLDIAPAKGWPAGLTPTAAQGLAVQAFATGLDHPRWLYVLPNGDVLVAESNAPAGKRGIGGLKGKVMGAVMKRAGSGVPSADRISLLRDADGDGVAEVRGVFAQGLTSPFGMVLVGDTLYIANADALVKLPYADGQQRAGAAPQKVADLPGGEGQLNHHWTKSLVASADGARLYVGVGSNSNIAENGLPAETDRAAVLEIDPATGTRRVYAHGLRNPVGLAWEPSSGTLWAVVNERDELGSDLAPDYLTQVEAGAFYGWPYSYWGQHVDSRVQPQRPDLVARARVPDYALGAHVASLGLSFAGNQRLGAPYADGAFVGLHGSWNRKPLAGYKVVFVPFRDGRPAGPMSDVLTGFLDAQGDARGRPVGVSIARDGALLVADDVGNAVWRVTAAGAAK
ncbi:PQQ-dependent sugar dehydrogenase [Lysobacter silvisoli]|uniref:Sorbosone dehydrogenase family protein n=1 Tax=Lysobacter silvisoli TaxID=2293254 RepID=A0A371JXN4_9GAMM|nr:sorbosone dehydrogenase family protein [Lysobacter silvisoli]RDZ26426.1 sorbosone dehydrogenase family protein [Lysobacter silvisoli]